MTARPHDPTAGPDLGKPGARGAVLQSVNLEWALTRRDAPISVLWVAWTAVAGLVLGALALKGILDLFGFQLTFEGQLFVVALPTAALSAGAAALGAKVRHPLGGALTILALCVAAGAVCATPTFVLTMLTNGEGLDEGGGPILAVAVIGAFYGAPLGALFGSVYAVVLGAGRAAAARPCAAQLDVVLAIAGLGWMGVGLACGLIARVDEGLASAGVAGWFLALAGCLLAATGVVRFEARRWWIGRVRGGRVPGWSIEPATPELPAAVPVYPFGACDAIVVSHEPLSEGPFRTGGGRRAWASVPSR